MTDNKLLLQNFIKLVGTTSNRNPNDLLNDLRSTVFNSPDESDNQKGICYFGYKLAEVGYTDLGIFLALKSLEYFNANKNESGQEFCYSNLGLIYYRRGEFKKAIKFTQKGMDLAVKNSPTSNQIPFYVNFGTVYYGVSEFNKAIEYQKKALSLIISEPTLTNKDELLCKCYGNLALNYQSTGMFNEAIKHHELALNIAKKNGDKEEEASNSLEYGETFRLLGKHDDAIRYYNESLKIAKKYFYPGIEAACYNNLGIICRIKNAFRQSVSFHQRALKIRKEISDIDGIASSYNNLANTHGDVASIGCNDPKLSKYAFSQFQLAFDYYKKSIKLYKQNKNATGLNSARLSKTVTIKDYHNCFSLTEIVKYKMNNIFKRVKIVGSI